MSMIPRMRLVVVATLLGCNPASEQSSGGAASSAALRSVPPDTQAIGARPPKVASASASPPAAAAPAGDLEGAWEGHYDAKKGTLTLPPKVKDKGFAADDGKTAAGRGAIDLVILAGGDVRGKTSGRARRRRDQRQGRRRR